MRTVGAHLRQNDVVRAASAAVWMVLETAGSPALQEAAGILHRAEVGGTRLRDRLRYILYVSMAVLCDSASLVLADEPHQSQAADCLESGDIVQRARTLIGILEQARLEDLSDAYGYFLAPPWASHVRDQRPRLHRLAFDITRFMIDRAWECKGHQLFAMNLPKRQS
jgi:hypothetical protein